MPVVSILLTRPVLCSLSSAAGETALLPERCPAGQERKALPFVGASSEGSCTPAAMKKMIAKRASPQDATVYGRWYRATRYVVLFFFTTIVVGIAWLLKIPFGDVGFWVSLATSLAGSVVFAAIYGFVAEDAAVHKMREEVEEALGDFVEREGAILDTLQRLEQQMEKTIQQEVQKALDQVIEREEGVRQFLPTQRYDPSEVPGPRFNKHIQESLNTSRTYIFKGPTGKQVGARIRLRAMRGLHCKVFLFDPRNDAVIQSHARNRYPSGGQPGEIQEMCQRIRKQIYSALVELYDLSQRDQIEIYLVDEIMYYRLEMVDDGVFVSHYETGKMTKYPLTLFFDKNSPYYHIYQYECDRLAACVVEKKKRITFRYDQPGGKDRDIKRVLRNLIGTDVTDEFLRELRATNVEFYEAIKSNLNL